LGFAYKHPDSMQFPSAEALLIPEFNQVRSHTLKTRNRVFKRSWAQLFENAFFLLLRQGTVLLSCFFLYLEKCFTCAQTVSRAVQKVIAFFLALKTCTFLERGGIVSSEES
jgi:hypothetical protein